MGGGVGGCGGGGGAGEGNLLLFFLSNIFCCFNAKDLFLSETVLVISLRKQAYSNILKILPPKNENFRIKNSNMFHISAQNIDCG